MNRTRDILRFQHRRNRSKRRAYDDLSKPRLVVFRSARHIYAQLVDDRNGHTLVACSTVEKAIRERLSAETSKVEQSRLVGQELATRALEHKVGQVVFDRNGYIYHGRVQALADGARTGGLKF